ncbi:FHA domain-containing protein, partial [Cellulomonas sp. 179-A 9B4 NHS]|uniref:FHA domain-containing protein n=1 Tax=Cellulomonas sp. 179-A 9B4 NHS TaxID=3142379 RepID=UPI0039A06B2E
RQARPRVRRARRGAGVAGETAAAHDVVADDAGARASTVDADGSRSAEVVAAGPVAEVVPAAVDEPARSGAAEPAPTSAVPRPAADEPVADEPADVAPADVAPTDATASASASASAPEPRPTALPPLPPDDLPPVPDLPAPPELPTVPDLPPPPAAPADPIALPLDAAPADPTPLDPAPAGGGTDVLGLPTTPDATADDDVQDTVLEDGWWRSAPATTPDVLPAPPAAAPGAPAALHAAPASTDPWAAPVAAPVATQDPLDPSDDDHDGMTILSSDLARLRDRLPAWTHDAVPGPFPTPEPTPLPARLVLSTGLVVELDRAVLLGRAPQVSRVTAKELPRLVTVPSPNQDISRTHAEVRLDGDHVVVTDLDSTNGVHVSRPGEGVRRLPAGEPSVVATDEVVDLGDGVTFTVERTA